MWIAGNREYQPANDEKNIRALPRNADIQVVLQTKGLLPSRYIPFLVITRDTTVTSDMGLVPKPSPAEQPPSYVYYIAADQNGNPSIYASPIGSNKTVPFKLKEDLSREAQVHFYKLNEVNPDGTYQDRTLVKIDPQTVEGPITCTQLNPIKRMSTNQSNAFCYELQSGWNVLEHRQGENPWMYDTNTEQWIDLRISGDYRSGSVCTIILSALHPTDPNKMIVYNGSGSLY
jgi:hypothetical protein